MSLIQEALNKTQSKISPAKIPQNYGSVDHQPDRTKRLKEFDREVEEGILKFQKISRQPSRKRGQNGKIALWSFFGVLFIAGIFYWSKNQEEMMATPPLTVDIERHELSAKAPSQVLAALHKKPEVASPTDSKGRFYLSGIAVGGDYPYAVINDKIFRIGEAVERGVIVQAIHASHVILSFRGVEIRLTLRR